MDEDEITVGEAAPDQGALDHGTRETGDRRFGFVAIIGPTNAGKSTLVNRMVGAKVTIVSRKVQTTRAAIRGIFIEDASQVVLVDTPGIFEPRRRLDRAMVDAAWSGAGDADLSLVLVDAQKGLDDALRSILDKLKASGKPRLLVMNKVDLVENKPDLLATVAAITELLPFEEVHFISATAGEGVEGLRADLASRVPEGPWLYEDDDISDLPMRMLAAEVLREKIYDRLHQELPYATTVETSDWRDMGKRGIRIEQTIYVQRESQRAIVLGKKGQTIKAMSTEARIELTEMLARPVHLFTFVKVRENWSDDPERFREMGLDFPKS
ncbi:MAG: GTPase Era [Pseudomonadota bacterium]